MELIKRIEKLEKELAELKQQAQQEQEQDWLQKKSEFYCINSVGTVEIDRWLCLKSDTKRKNFLGVYKTKKQAELVRDRFRAVRIIADIIGWPSVFRILWKNISFAEGGIFTKELKEFDIDLEKISSE